jgi:tetratricopeptide (TPR) repeat protein
MGRTGKRRGGHQPRVDLLIRQEIRLHVQKGRAALRQGRLADAEQCLQKALGIEPSNRVALGTLGEIHLRRNDFPVACELLGRALEAGERTEHLLYTLANACRGAQKRDQAFTHYQELVDLNPGHVKGLTRLGEGFLERKDFERARQCFARALERESRNLFALRGLASALRGKRDYRAAIPVFTELARLDPGDHRVLVRLADACVHEGDREAARRAYLLALEIDPDNRYAKQGLASLS